MDARLNLGTQEIYEISRAADPLGRRTLGVLTKCDVIPEGEQENVRSRLRLGDETSVKLIPYHRR
jgi:hypothetical protein